MMYELLFYDGWSTIPAYYLVGGVEGETPEQALSVNLDWATRQVRSLLGLPQDTVSDERLQETIYVVRPDGLVSPREIGATSSA